MTALDQDRNTPHREGAEFAFDVAADTVIYAGSIVQLDSSGNAEPGATATGKIAAGMALEFVDNTDGNAGDKTVKVLSGRAFRFENGESITKASIGDHAYITDDQTVGTTATGKSPAGAIVDVDDLGVWVFMHPPIGPTTTGLLAANNLSEVTAATARANLGLDTANSPTFAALTVTGAVATGSLTSVGTATGRQKWQTVAASAYLVTTADGDIVIEGAADNDVVTLPDAAAGNKGQRITVFCSAADGAAKVSVSPHSSDKIYGTVPNAAADSVSSAGTDKDFILTKATQNKGDFVVLVSDGSTGWYIIGGVGIWASEP